MRMPCYDPFRVLKKNGELDWTKDPRILFTGESVFNVPCRVCIGCERAEARDWAVRCYHHSLDHSATWREPKSKVRTVIPNSCVITLTYSPEHLGDPALKHKDFQRFMMRLRNFRERKTNIKTPVTHLMCGEYGGESGRKHFHAIIFGHQFDDQYDDPAWIPGTKLHKMSYELDSLWQQKAPGHDYATKIGRATVDNFTFEGSSYVAGYVAKKITTAQTGPARWETDPATSIAKLVHFAPEYRRQTPGLANNWLLKNKQANLVELYRQGSIKISELIFPYPTSYDRLLKQYRPDLHTEVLKQRQIGMEETHAQWTPERCAAAETIALSSLSLRQDSL